MKVTLDLGDEFIERIVVEVLERTYTLQWALIQKGAADEEAEEIIAACKKLIEYFKVEE